MRSEPDGDKPRAATAKHAMIAAVVVLIFLVPFLLEFFLADNELTIWLNSGMRVVWFYAICYSALLLFLTSIDKRRQR